MELTPEAIKAYTVQSYDKSPSIPGVQRIPLRRNADDGGAFIELGRFRPDDLSNHQLAGFNLAQINYSTIEPGVIKAYHLHPTQMDVWFVPPEDRLLMVLADVRDFPQGGNIMRFIAGYGQPQLIMIPKGVAHGARNLATTTGHIFYLVDRVFDPDPEKCEEGRLPWDHFGADIWETVRG